MPKRQLIIVAIVLIVTTALFVSTAFHQQAQDKPPYGQEEATVVKKGQVTEKEREYSKEYKKLYSYRKGQKLSESRGTEDFSVIIDLPDKAELSNQSVISAKEYLESLSCNADTIVVGSIRNKSAHLFEDETFVYTEYEFSVEEVIKDNPASPVKVKSGIQITRPGGIIKLNNRRIVVEDFSYEPLQKNKSYLLFLRFIPAANGYVVASDKGDFILESNSFKNLAKQSLPEELERKNSQKLLIDVRDAASTSCNQRPIGGN